MTARWYAADMGVRRSNTRRCESVDTHEIKCGLLGQYDVLYAQLPTGSVLRDSLRAGDHCVWRRGESVSEQVSK